MEIQDDSRDGYDDNDIEELSENDANEDASGLAELDLYLDTQFEP
ncbi:15814_t:CDS:2 [Racocetra fulgida]|uniref:15814_t:CDS:1 n=1 Tax=Racocetra fulgida TaxID=60492 RepID=A0A9N9HC61_9GLOM|nr:15814_t:CDS:2 [Racocetra fulgida]